MNFMAMIDSSPVLRSFRNLKGMRFSLAHLKMESALLMPVMELTTVFVLTCAPRLLA